MGNLWRTKAALRLLDEAEENFQVMCRSNGNGYTMTDLSAALLLSIEAVDNIRRTYAAESGMMLSAANRLNISWIKQQVELNDYI